MMRKFFIPVLLIAIPFFVFSQSPSGTPSADKDEPVYTVESLSASDWLNRVPQKVQSLYSPEKRYSEPYDTDLFLAITIHEIPDHDFWLLDFMSPFEWISIHYRNQTNGNWISLKTGDQVAMKDREIQHRTQVLPVTLEQGTVLYLHLLDYQQKAPDFRILLPKIFIAVNERKDGLLIFGLSLVFFTTLYNFFRFFLDRNKYYLYYGVVLLFELIANLGKLRLYSFLFVPFQPYGYFLYIFCNSIAVIAAVSFCLVFFEISPKNLLGRILKILRALLWPVVVLSVLYPYPMLGDLMNLIIVPTLVMILGMTVFKVFRGKDLSSRLILLSFLPLLVGVIWENLNIYMGYDKFHSLNLTQILVIFLHIVLMSLGSARKDSELKRSYQKLQENFSETVDHEVHKRTREIETLASRDGLTGLFNRKSLEKSISIIESKVSKYTPLGVVFLDLDNFKYYNDNFGHAAGDRILVMTARLLSSNTRQDDLIFRYGGDEFLILMPETSQSLVESISKRIHAEFQVMAEDFCSSLEKQEHRLGLSLGVSVWSSEAGTLLRHSIDLADGALLRVKKQGKNQVLLTSS